MVRVISEKLFSPPRSRHSSGETVDKELAARAVEVLSSLNSRRLELSDCESSSDSHWDSEVDVEGDGGDGTTSRDPSMGGERKQGTDVLRKRKERRRERNKLSAQAYRVRRKEQTVKQQTVLQSLQADNVRLKKTMQSLEDELKTVRRSLRQQRYLTSTPPFPQTGPPSTPTPDSPGPSTPSVNKLTMFRPPTEKTAPETISVPAMDNDQCRRQQISPVVDNFVFNKPLLTTAPPGAIKVPPSMTSPLSFPPAPHVMGMRHNFGAATFLASPLPTISEKPDGTFGHHIHHPKSQLQQPADLNANANTLAFSNANTMNVNVFGMCKNSNMNNNNNLYQGMNGEAGARTDLVAQQQNPFKVCKV
ncbi:hypothetical protein ACOMHN_026562 [Nucella lapillus]